MDNWLKACKSFFSNNLKQYHSTDVARNVSNKTILNYFKQPSNNHKQLQTTSNLEPKNIIYEKTFDLGNGTSLG